MDAELFELQLIGKGASHYTKSNATSTFPHPFSHSLRWLLKPQLD